MKRRQYREASDLDRLQAFNAAAIAETNDCGFLYPGDIPHHLFNGNRFFDPAEVMNIWELDDEIAAWVLVGPRHAGYDAQVRPDLRTREFEAEILDFAESETLRLMTLHGIDDEHMVAYSHRCDTLRSDLLIETGWALVDQPPEVVNRQRLTELEEPVLPDAYTIRAARGVEDAAALAELHGASFGSSWTTELYEKVMRSPGYAPEREFVAVAPDGTFAAFTVTWHDHLNKTGEFEPVGTHADHRRLGLGTALLRHGMKAMADAGMEYATVGNLGDNEASAGLYRSAGFVPWRVIDDYTKPVRTSGSDGNT